MRKKRIKFRRRKKKASIHANKNVKTVKKKKNVKGTQVKNVRANVLATVREGTIAEPGVAAMFNQVVQTALSWHCETKLVRRNPPRKIGESGERRILRMAKSGYDVWEAWQILGTYDYSTIKRVYVQHGYINRENWS